eukprot:gene27364-4666_t
MTSTPGTRTLALVDQSSIMRYLNFPVKCLASLENYAADKAPPRPPIVTRFVHFFVSSFLTSAVLGGVSSLVSADITQETPSWDGFSSLNLMDFLEIPNGSANGRVSSTLDRHSSQSTKVMPGQTSKDSNLSSIFTSPQDEELDSWGPRSGLEHGLKAGHAQSQFYDSLPDPLSCAQNFGGNQMNLAFMPRRVQLPGSLVPETKHMSHHFSQPQLAIGPQAMSLGSMGGCFNSLGSLGSYGSMGDLPSSGLLMGDVTSSGLMLSLDSVDEATQFLPSYQQLHSSSLYCAPQQPRLSPQFNSLNPNSAGVHPQASQLPQHLDKQAKYMR